jgi:hypothetical protein
MKGTRRSETNVGQFAVGMLVATLAWFSVTSTAVHAQCGTTRGFNTIYGQIGNCSSDKQGSFAFVDATEYSAGGSDICGPIQTVLNTYANGLSGSPLSGVIVDARGFTSGNLTCTTNPWSQPLPHSNVVLLPAGTIVLSQTLVMPVNTKLVGAGSGLVGTGLTTLASGSGFPPGADIIDMGNSTVCQNANGPTDCEGVVVEHLAIQGVSSGAAAIRNQYSQELSYVNDVVISGGTGSIGLWLDVHADNSGPYTNIRYSGSGTCAQFYDSFKTFKLRNSRGIHGLTCIMSGGNSPAVYVDAPNNSIEDVNIQGTGSTQDGIVIGARAAAYNNVLFNVTGSGLRNLIHICGLSASGSCLGSAPPANVSDVTILGATNSAGGGSILEDDLTNTTLSDAHLGMYVVGEPVQANSTGIGYSRFTTSPSVPAWLVGTGPPSGSTCAFGALYSASGGTQASSIYGCTGASNGPWTPIK